MNKTSFDHLQGRSWTLGNSEESPEQIEATRSRDWFAVTAFPIFAGTFGPIASALNLCSLVQPWKTAPIGTDGGDFTDPKWLIGFQAVSLIFGIAANIAMFLVFNDGVDFLIQNRHNFLTFTIVGEMVASLILVVLLTAARLVSWTPIHALTDDYAFTEAFWFGILSAGVYTITSGFSIYTLYMLRASTRSGREEHRIQLAKGHHRLMVLTVLFINYILSGAAIFSHIEGWKFLDAVYWADVTVLTIGYGDFYPKTHLGRSLMLPWSAGGIIILFLTIYSITSLVLEQRSSPWEVHLRDKHRLKKILQLKRTRQEKRTRKVSSRFGYLWNAKARVDNENLDALAQTHDLVDTLEIRSEVSQQRDEREVRREAFNHMQDVLVTSARKRLFYSIIFWGSTLLSVWLAGATVFYFAEYSQHWSFFQTFYFAYVSLTGIGYGDFALKSPAGRAFFFLWSFIAVATVTMVIKNVVHAAGSPYVLHRKDFGKSLSGYFGWRKGKQQVEKNSIADDELRRFHDLPHNVHDKTHLLVETIKQVVQDHLNYQYSGKRPQYAFEYWEKVLYLMGALEPTTARNRRDNEDGGCIGSISSSSSNNSMDQWKNPRGMADWLHGKNPLNATETLTEWLLVTMVDKLEAELLDLRMKVGAVTDGLGKKEEVVGIC
ncbi:hypothetical protein EG328_008776 [Venturia inaequalis]|uniref:Potassium channel domain-containing protein n=1 Tax=Venturia inaequalis TaxID=5025 RepID=A0A8H3UBP1_VENIN|nr:hypothetical protein EG328_008776 [Venturia inaequalis]KAE9987951.1 hypothetical protein EG327_003579 [Venturia inaequalis]